MFLCHSFVVPRLTDDTSDTVIDRANVKSRQCGQRMLYDVSYGNTPLVQQCIDYVQTEDWTMHDAVDVMPGPCGKYEFRKKYVSKKYVDHGASIQSLSCIMAVAATRCYSPSRSMCTSEMCPDCVIEFCKKYANDIKSLLPPHVIKCIKNQKEKLCQKNSEQ